MSRKVDLSKPLSDDDRQYLSDRCRWDDLREADANHPVPVERDPNTTPSSQDTSPAPQPADKGTQTAELPTKPLTTDSVPAQADPGDEDVDNYDDAEVWSYHDLQEEAKERKDVSAAGSREDIVARLREDDSNN